MKVKDRVRRKEKWVFKRKAKWSEWVSVGGGEMAWGSASQFFELLSSSLALSLRLLLFFFYFFSPFSSVAVAVNLCFQTEAPQVSGKHTKRHTPTHTHTHTHVATQGGEGSKNNSGLYRLGFSFKIYSMVFTVLCLCLYAWVGGWTGCPCSLLNTHTHA